MDDGKRMRERRQSLQWQSLVSMAPLDRARGLGVDAGDVDAPEALPYLQICRRASPALCSGAKGLACAPHT